MSRIPGPLRPYSVSPRSNSPKLSQLAPVAIVAVIMVPVAPFPVLPLLVAFQLAIMSMTPVSFNNPLLVIPILTRTPNVIVVIVRIIAPVMLTTNGTAGKYDQESKQ